MIGVSRTLLMVGGFRSKALLELLEEETVPSVVHCGSDWLPCCLIVAVSTPRESQLHVPVDVVRVKSYVNTLFNSESTSEVLSQNYKLNLVPEQIMPRLFGVFRNG